jgi:hypothetical protein
MPFRGETLPPNWSSEKIKLEKVENFQRSNRGHLHTTIHHTITTNPPANHHQKTHESPGTPLKNAAKQAKIAPPAKFFWSKIRTQKSSLALNSSPLAFS